MGFDKKAPGAGAEVYCTLEPGKAILEWKLYVTEEEPGAFFRILVYDKKDMLVLEGRQCVGEEELLRTLLLHPHLWRGPEDAYLYRAEIFLVGPGERGVLDKISFWFPIRSFREVLGKGWYLNGEPFCRKTVRYEAACLREEAQKELSLFVQMGANTVSIERPGKQPAFFYGLCEELGLVGASIIILLFLILIWRFFVIATRAKDLFGALIAAGAMAHMMIQVILNIAVVTNTIPNTGITLPFISYGGTSVVFLLFEMGLVLSVSRLVE